MTYRSTMVRLPRMRNITLISLTLTLMIISVISNTSIAAAEPTRDTCAMSAIVRTEGTQRDPSATLQLVVWTRNFMVGASGEDVKTELVWKVVPIQASMEIALTLGSVSWFAATIGVIGSAWTTSAWIEATPGQVVAITADDLGTFTTMPKIESETCEMVGGPKGCIAYTIRCELGSTCNKNKLSVSRSDQSGVFMELITISVNSFAFFVVSSTELRIGYENAGVSSVGDPVSENVRTSSTSFKLTPYSSITVGGCATKPRPPTTSIVFNSDDWKFSEGAPFSSKGESCDSPSHLPSVMPKGCVTFEFNYTSEVASKMNENIGVWFKTRDWMGPSSPASQRPIVWRSFTVLDQEVRFAFEFDYFIAVIQFPGTDRDGRDYIRGPLQLANIHEVWSCTADAYGLGYLKQSGSDGAEQVTLQPLTGGKLLAPNSYYCLWKGGHCVFLVPIQTGGYFALNASRIYFRGDSYFSELAIVQDFDLDTVAKPFVLPAPPATNQPPIGIRTIIDMYLTFEEYNTTNSGGGGGGGGGCDPVVDCNNHGTCDAVSHACQCFDGWDGSDCSNGTLPKPPVLPGVVWSTVIGASITMSHLTMGVVLPSWSFRAAAGFFQFSALLSHSGVNLPTNVRSMAKQFDMLNFVLKDPGQTSLPSQQDEYNGDVNGGSGSSNGTQWNTTHSTLHSRRLRALLSNDPDSPSSGIISDNLTPDEYRDLIRDNSDVFMLTFVSLAGVLGVSWLVCLLLIGADRCLHGPFDEYVAMAKVGAMGSNNMHSDDEMQEKANSKGADLETIETAIDSAASPKSDDIADDSSTTAETIPKPTTLVPTVLWFLRANSSSYRIHLRKLPLCLTLHLIKFAYYGLCFSSFRHIAWFTHSHTTVFITMLAWLTALSCLIGMPFAVGKVLQRQQLMLCHQHTSKIAFGEARIFTFTYSALLDGPLRPTRRRWALWIILRRLTLAIALAVLAMNTVQSETQWGMRPEAATSAQLGLCLAIMILYTICLGLQRPYASQAVNRLQFTYEVIGCTMLIALLIYHKYQEAFWINFVLGLNLLGATVSFAVFLLMVYELSRPFHRRIAHAFNSCCGGENSRNRAEEDGLAHPTGEYEKGDLTAPPTVLAQQLFPNMDLEPIVAGRSDEPYSPANPPPLPIKRRKKPTTATIAHASLDEREAHQRELNQALL